MVVIFFFLSTSRFWRIVRKKGAQLVLILPSSSICCQIKKGKTSRVKLSRMKDDFQNSFPLAFFEITSAKRSQLLFSLGRFHATKKLLNMILTIDVCLFAAFNTK